MGSRITTFGLADLRGGLHFGFDCKAHGSQRVLRRRPDARLRRMSLSRRHFQREAILLHGMALLFVASLPDRCRHVTAFLTAQFLAGVGTGTFIPLTIGFIVRNLPQRLINLDRNCLADGDRPHPRVGDR